MSAVISNANQLVGMLGELSKAADRLKDEISEEDRAKAVKLAERLTLSLEDPRDAVLKMAFSPAQATCVRIAIDLSIFNTLADRNAPVTLEELSAVKNADPVLAERVLRVLTGINFVDEVDTRKYIANSMTRELTLPGRVAGMRFMFDAGVPALSRTPEFLRKTQFVNPPEANDGPFQLAEATKDSLWTWLPKNPQVHYDFLQFLEAEKADRARWVDWFPVQERLIDGFHDGEGEVLFVDVAGNRGHDVKELHSRFPNAPGRIVLEDEKHILDEADVAEKIERVVFDLFKPQPIQGARAYYMKLIMHDWRDNQCVEILQHIRCAMKNGYSKLIIEEYVMPSKEIPLLNATWDWMLLAECSSMERTQDHWLKLLAAAGFESVKIWSPPRHGLSIIEAEVV